MADESDPTIHPFEYGEICSCGARFSVSGKLESYAYAMKMATVVELATAWRKDHHHDKPARDVSTTAKGAFGYVRYAQGYEEDDEEDDD